MDRIIDSSTIMRSSHSNIWLHTDIVVDFTGLSLILDAENEILLTFFNSKTLFLSILLLHVYAKELVEQSNINLKA